jgi:hypothetical protein
MGAIGIASASFVAQMAIPPTAPATIAFWARARKARRLGVAILVLLSSLNYPVLRTDWKAYAALPDFDEQFRMAPRLTANDRRGHPMKP